MNSFKWSALLEEYTIASCFGVSVAINDNTAVVGAHGDDSNEGSAYVYGQTVSGAPPAGPVYLPIVLRNAS